MKRFFKTTLLLPLALTGSMLIAQKQPRPAAEGQTQQDSQQTITGKIVRSDDGKYVLVDSQGTMYQLDDQSNAKKFAGKMVKVSGIVDTTSNSIHVTEISAAY
jgi:hypothetical protein